MLINIIIDTDKPILEQVEKQLPPPTYIVTKDDINLSGWTFKLINGIKEQPFTRLGKVMDCDVGKLCKKVKGEWYVENLAQFKNRTNVK